jgi:hypothetical protein
MMGVCGIEHCGTFRPETVSGGTEQPAAQPTYKKNMHVRNQRLDWYFSQYCPAIFCASASWDLDSFLAT